jgi:tetratricopeptide (TPR) repeat protein
MEPTPDRVRAGSPVRAHLDRGFRYEQGGALARALEAYREALKSAVTPFDRAESHLRIARIHRSMSAWTECRTESAEAIRLATEVGAEDLAAEAMNVEIGALQIRGFLDEADALAIRALERARSPRVRGITLQNLGRSAAERRDFATADQYFAQSISAFRTAEYSIGVAVALTNAAKAALDRGNVQRSIEIGEEAVALARALNALDVLLTIIQNQSAALMVIGRLDAAEALLTEALGHFTSAHNVVRQAECLEIMGTISERRPDFETAERCYLRARKLAEQASDAPLIERLDNRLDALATIRDATGRNG